MDKGNKVERELMLYWYYSIMNLFLKEEIDDQDIKEGINFLKFYHINKYKIPMRDRNKLFKNKGDAYAFVKLCLLFPQNYYDVDFKSALAKSIKFNKKNNEEAELGDYLSSNSTVSKIADRYEELIFYSDEDAGEWINIELKEYNTLFKFMIPDNPKKKFLEFIEDLRKEGVVPLKEDENMRKVNLKPLRQKDALELLKKLEDDKFKPSKHELAMIKHKSFKAYRTDYLNKFRDKGFDVSIDILEREKFLPLEKFYKLCKSPSSYYNKYLLSSFEWYCTWDGPRAKGEYVNRLRNKIFSSKSIRNVGTKKIKVIKISVKR